MDYVRSIKTLYLQVSHKSGSKIQLKGGFPKLEREDRMGIGDRHTCLSGNLLANGGAFGSDNIGSQFDIIVNGSNFATLVRLRFY